MKTLTLILALLVSLQAYSQTDVVITDIPQRYQLLPRGSNNISVIRIAGMSLNPRYDSVYAVVLQQGEFLQRVSAPLIYTNDTASFELSPIIYAGLMEYDLSVYTHSAAGDSLVAFRDSIVSGDVYIVDGQSNTVWTGNVGNLYTNEYCRTFGITASSNPADTLWANSVAVLSATAPNVGSWVLRMQQRILEEQGIPTCIINGGVGGTQIEAHQRNDANPTQLNTIYGSLLYRVQKAKVADYVKAMFWYQGESNGPVGYYNNFKSMYDDWREDYPYFRKLYMFQVHHGCYGGQPQGEVREIHRSIKDSIPNVVQVSVMGIDGHDGCHYTTVGYQSIGDMVYKQVARDFYYIDDKVALDPPNIQKAFFRDQAHTTLVLGFTSAGASLVMQGDTTVQGITASLKEYFYLDTDTAVVSDLSAEGNKLVLHLKSASNAQTITYLPDTYYDGTGIVYQGPYLKNARGIGALTFWRFPISDSAKTSVDMHNDEVQLSAYPNPFTKTTTLTYSLAHTSHVRIEIVDALGRHKQTLVNELMPRGSYEHSIEFNRNIYTPGIYYCNIHTGGIVKTISLVVE